MVIDGKTRRILDKAIKLLLRKCDFLYNKYCILIFNMIEFYSWKIEYIRKKMNYLVKRNNRFKGIFLFTTYLKIYICIT